MFFFFFLPFLIIGYSHPSDFFFGGKNLPFWFLKKVQSNMVKGTFRKNSKKVVTFSGFFCWNYENFRRIWVDFLVIFR
jgi:hypothetical protein